MSTEHLRFDISDHVATITINRPEQKNALSQAMSSALMDHIHEIRENRDIRVGLITGAGGVFCAGADLKERAAGGGGRAQDRAATTVVEADLSTQWWSMKIEKPLIAAVDGYALAAGFELALACDIRVCSTNAQFGLPEITRGFFPGGGGPQRLARFIPQSMAMEMVLTGDRIDAHRALACGLVSRVVEPDELLSTAQQIASRIAGHAPLAVRAAKEVTQAALDMTFEQSMRLGGSLRWVIGQTDDAKEGPQAFAEKRDPVFKGQ